MDVEYAENYDGSTDETVGSGADIPSYHEAMRFFIENKGQVDGEVKFVAVTEFGKVLFYDSKVQYLLERYEDRNLTGMDVITLTFPSSSIVSPQGMGLLPHHTNYFVGDPSDWVTDVGNYRSIIYEDLWPGIDLTYRFSEKGLKYEFKVDPYVLEQRIGIRVEGAALQSERTYLTFATGHGSLVDSDLIAWQDSPEEMLPVAFVIKGDVITFKTEGRDLSKGPSD